MLRRVQKLFNEPGFREAPLTVLARAAKLAVAVPTGTLAPFELIPGGPKVKVPADFRYTTLSTFLLRDAMEPELHTIQKFVGAGDVFVDVGANIGLFTVKVAPKAAKVIAVEPGEAARAQLLGNIALNGFTNVTVVPKALADKEGTAALHHNPVGDDPQSFSLISDGSDAGSEQVAMTTLDAVVRDAGVDRVDCIKIDVEGAEGMVIAGGQHTLSTYHPTVIFEMNCPTLFKAGGDPAAAWSALKALGYSFYQVSHDGTLTALATRPTEFCNIVARHPSRA
ncbi:FkbM family methyltransferase [Xanthobacter pseudotagetidis]|uniref:FkbM family methyltransferase n=1 Tax=Xanthobacter pseudotagetidis TaxID=3119911 RepID=UPI0037288EFB